ncbi:MAG: type I methionyl aminopeptidase [Roseateles depolymerans]|uniref:Methionine aminopeptidase n=1 Tax=Roseateles depolymerans TaxID=76731 RepID=A0A2W5G3S8_9BURK|nr:MAG: type I methionyl aminopeptidase [Roseateles depolymerans]
MKSIKIRSPEEVAKARTAGHLIAEVLAMLKPHVVPGVTTGELDDLCHDYIVNKLGCIPSNVGYHGFPKTACVSPNHVVCHGIPSPDKKLKKGDIVNVDVTLTKDGWFGDSSRMFFVGEPGPLAKRLVTTTYEALRAGIRQVRPGATLGDVGHAIQQVALAAGYSVVREYGGHGIGDIYHDEPHVNHFGRPGEGLRLQEGMIFTIEPMINAGQAAIKELSDGWTVVTKDHSLSAQWEHMVTVTKDGFEILTPWPDGLGEYAAIAD